MQDFIKKYREHKLFSNLNIVLASLVLAFWVNFLILDWTNLWQSLKVSIVNTNVIENKSDISIEKFNEKLYIISNKEINEINNLSLSIIYNPENITLSKLKSSFWDVVNLTNTTWISSIILTADKWTIVKKWDKLIQININKKEEKAENINIINANFKDINNEHYLLSTSWITF